MEHSYQAIIFSIIYQTSFFSLFLTKKERHSLKAHMEWTQSSHVLSLVHFYLDTLRESTVGLFGVWDT